MESSADALEVDASSGTEGAVRENSNSSALSEFEGVYRANVGVVTAYFARRCSEPQTVADLTSETIVRAAAGFAGFDPRRGTPGAWLYGITRHVYAQHCADTAGGRDVVARLAGLSFFQQKRSTNWRRGSTASAPVERCSNAAQRSRLPSGRRWNWSISTVSPQRRRRRSLASPRGVLRMRLSRARAHLRKEHHVDEEV